nr:MAG TPA: hypothetical protein [Caudoviricetes sp.]
MYAKTYEILNECTVQMTPELAEMCNLHKASRDPVGINIFPDEKSVNQITKMLLGNGKNVLKGREEDFICISRSQYEEILRIISNMQD